MFKNDFLALSVTTRILDYLYLTSHLNLLFLTQHFFQMTSNFISLDRWLFNSNLTSSATYTQEEQCQIAHSFREKRVFVLIVLVQLLLSATTLAIIVLLVREKKMRKLWALIGRDLKVRSLGA